MSRQFITINNWSGGASLNDAVAGGNQYAYGSQMDHWSFPGKVGLIPGLSAIPYKSSNDWGGPVTAMCNSKGEDTIFYAIDEGTDWQIVKGESVTSDSFSLSSAQEIVSMQEYYNETLAVTESGSVYVTNATTTSGSNTNGWNLVIDIWQSTDQVVFSGLSKVCHQISAIDRHYFTANEYVASVNGDPTNSANYDKFAFNVGAGWETRSLAPYGNQYLAIASNYTNGQISPTRNKISIWDGVGTTSVRQLTVPERFVKAIYSLNGYLWIWAGISCNLYVNPIGSEIVTLIKRFYNASTGIDRVDFDVHPHAVTHKENRIYFGLSNVDQTSEEQNPGGIYSFNADPNQFDIAQAYPQQSAKSYYQNLIVGQVDNRNALYFTEKTSAGVDNVFRQRLFTSENTYGTAFLAKPMESAYFDAPAGQKIRVASVAFDVDTWPAGAGLEASIINEEGTIQSYGSLTAGDTFTVAHKTIEGRRIKLRIALTGIIADVSPFIRRVMIGYELIPDNQQ